MPWDEVMHKFGRGALHSGSKTGPVVKSRKQAIAIEMSEKRKAAEGVSEYARKHVEREKAKAKKKNG